MHGSKGRVLVTGAAVNVPELSRLEQAGLSFELETRTMSRAGMIERLKGFDYYIYGGAEATDELDVEDFRLLAATGLKLIAFAGKDVSEFLNVRAASSAGILITNTPGAVEPNVADFTAFLTMALLRQSFARAFNWTHNLSAIENPVSTNFPLGSDLCDAQVGIIGLGDIGYLTAKLLHGGYGSRVYYYSRRPKPLIEAELGIQYLSAGELLDRCDVVSLHLPLSDGTAKFVEDIPFEESGSPVMLVNTSSEKLIPIRRLVSLLGSGTVSAAAFDKIYPAPDVLVAGLAPFIPERLLVTNHSANATTGAWRRMTASAVDVVLSLNSGQTPTGIVVG